MLFHRSARIAATLLLAPLVVGALACIPRETTHRIEAHIVLDIRRIQDQAGAVEAEVRGGGGGGGDSDGASTEPARGPGARVVSAVQGREVASAGELPGLFTGGARFASLESTPEEREAIARRKERFRQIDPLLEKGRAGENNRGMLEARDVPAEERDAVRALIDAENADRRTIYRAVAVREGLSADEFEAIGEVWALGILKEMRPGRWFQVPSKDRLFEAFRDSALGRKLPAARKGEWLRVP